MTEIRAETPDDHEGISRLIVDAFRQSELGYHGEAELVDRLRQREAKMLSLVAVDDDSILGHIVFSPVTLFGETRQLVGMGPAPLAVAPDHQRRGIGSALVREGLKQLAALGCPFVVVLGHPDYYPRLGFVPAAEFGIKHGFAGIPQDVFFVTFLRRDSWDGSAAAIASFSGAFDV